jgi:hypothetical protein
MESEELPPQPVRQRAKIITRTNNTLNFFFIVVPPWYVQIKKMFLKCSLKHEYTIT